MSAVVKFENLQDRIIEIRDQKVLLDIDVADIYGVETKRISEAVKNNPDKFPSGYIIELDKAEWGGLKSKFSTSKKGGKFNLFYCCKKRGRTNPAPLPSREREYFRHRRHTGV